MDPRHPVHLTLPFAKGVPSLRTPKAHDAVRGVLRALHDAREDFRVVAYSLQTNHLHLIAEADSPRAFRSGARSLTIRLGVRLNEALSRSGRIFADTYHGRELGTPREVRNGLAYVLLNHRSHAARMREATSQPLVDPYSSARWFDGWTVRVRTEREPPAVRRPETWLARVGWKRHGLLSPFEVPGASWVRR